jgi:hypothetical protein
MPLSGCTVELLFIALDRIERQLPFAMTPPAILLPVWPFPASDSANVSKKQSAV